MRPICALLPLVLAGCVGFELEHNRVGLPDAVKSARSLEVGKTTLRDTMERLGPPDLILPVSADVNRAWYTYWNGDYFRFVVKISLPLVNNASIDLYILTFGSEELHLARLEFNREDVLTDVQTGVFPADRQGQYFGVDSTLASAFIEDRDRALHVRQEEDEDP